MNATRLAVIPIALLLFGCSNDSNVGPTTPNSSVDADELLQAQITLPPGFQINVFAPGVTRPRSMVVGDNGTVFVGSYFFTKGVTSPVYALRDEDGDGFAEFRREIWNGFNTPNGLAFHDGTLWIVDEDRVWRIDNVEETLDNPQPRLIYSGLPSRAETDQATNVGHWWRYMTYGPDDKL